MQTSEPSDTSKNATEMESVGSQMGRAIRKTRVLIQGKSLFVCEALWITCPSVANNNNMPMLPRRQNIEMLQQFIRHFVRSVATKYNCRINGFAANGYVTD